MEYKSPTERKIAWRVEFGRWRLIEYMLEEHTYATRGSWVTIKLEEIKAIKEKYYVKMADFSFSRLTAVLVYLRNKRLIEFKVEDKVKGWYRFRILSESDFMNTWNETRILIPKIKKAKIVK